MEIIIYSKDNCSYCQKAKMYLNNKDITYTEIKIGDDISREDVLDMFPNVRTVPIIVIDGVYIGGYSQLIEKV